MKNEMFLKKLNIAIFIICLLGALRIFLLDEYLEPLYMYCVLMGITGLRIVFKKTIPLSKKDYQVLMELSKELQTQTNNYQAYPYFWEPSSYKTVVNIHGEGELTEVYHDCETYDLKEFAESDEFENYRKFLEYEDTENIPENNDILYDPDLESEWQDYIDSEIDDTDIWTLDWEDQQDHNPSLFLSDVELHIKQNTHHLGRKPHTYSRTIGRMNKMYDLVQILMRLNPQSKEIVNHEALRFVYPNKKHTKKKR